MWKPVPGYEDRYEINKEGVVYSKRSMRNNGLIKHQLSNKGYPRVYLFDGWGYRWHLVHLLVLTIFKGPRPTQNHEGSHQDGDPLNCSLYNLKWETISQNNLRKRKHGTACIGQKNPLSKLTDRRILLIRHAYAQGKSQAQLGRQYGVHQTVIGDIVRGETWTHVGGPRIRYGKGKDYGRSS